MTSYVRAMYDFTGQPGTTEMSITVGEVLSVTSTDMGQGWWEGQNTKGEVGLFPAAYVEVLSASEAQKYQHKAPAKSTVDVASVAPTTTAAQLMADVFSSNNNNNNNNRYDQTADDDDEWEDDWDEDNETYSEIGPSGGYGGVSGGNSSALSRIQNAGVGGGAMQHNIPHSSSYESKHLPATPQDDTLSLASQSQSINSQAVNATTLKKSGMFGKSSDSYILGLSVQKDKIPDEEIIQIVPLDTFYQWLSNHTPYTVIVASPKKESKFKGMKTFIAYQLTPSFNNISVFRRYKHFDWLHERLVEKFCLIPIPPLPDKQISGRYEEQFVEHRRVQLQEFVDWVCRHPVLQKCEVWHHFLTCTDDKIWKSGKRKAERDPYVGITYCLALRPPEKQLLQSYVDAQMDRTNLFIHTMDGATRNLLAIANDTIKRYQFQAKKEFQRIGDGLSDMAKALDIDERRAPSDFSLSGSIGRIGGIFIGIGQIFGDQPKFDWIPLSDRLHIYRGILSSFPDILTTHKGAMQKRKECERLTAESKMNNQQLADVNRRTDVITYAVLAEITHFRQERDTHLKQTVKSFIEEQIKFYTTIVAKLQDAYKQID